MVRLLGVLLTITCLGSADLQFNRDVRPILADHCFPCHGFDAKSRKAGLRLDTEDAFRPNRAGHTAIQPGNLAQSTLWERIQSDDPDEIMPPPELHKPLSEPQKDTLRRWIEAGAVYQKHWAFEPPVKQEPPTSINQVDGVGQVHPIDAFIRHELSNRTLEPSPEASRARLIRRLSFDLTGLPPTPVEVDAFVSDSTSEAYGRLVDRLMDSPRFGEQMARHWLDLARYADTHGLHLDNERQMWAYRDWVIEAFNRNLPFDQFTIEQLAGDLLPDATRDQLIATGFNRCNVTTSEGGSIDAEFIYRYAVERTSTTVQTWMGLTAGCAQCHDHKFDPISAREFYSMYAFFHSSADPAMDGNALLTRPTLKLPTLSDEEELAALAGKVQDVEARMLTELRGLTYVDPVDMESPPSVEKVEDVWFDDAFAEGASVNASPGAPTQLVEAADGPVFSGKKSLRRQDKGLAQDVIEGGSIHLVIPQDGRLFAHVYLDPSDLPGAIMLQYKTGEWKHRAVWGKYDLIEFGTRDTTERVHQGDLPAAGEWVRLEIAAADVGLMPGTKLTGYALTQHGGTVYWDKIGVTGLNDPVTNPGRSFAAWLKSVQGKNVDSLSAHLKTVVKDVAENEWTETQRNELRDHYLSRVCLETRSVFESLQAEIRTLDEKKKAVENRIPATFIWSDLEKPRESFIMMRGAYDQPGEKVTRGVPEVLPPLPDKDTLDRLDLAQWLMSDEHPLTARVAANRLWQQFFGMGLVRTSEDFGSQGEPPSHPELLDWLAVTYREMGWNTKDFIRMLVTSHAYRQNSSVTEQVLELDPDNRWLSRGPRFRLDAEQIRDNALYVSGLLDFQMGGRGVRTYQPPNVWEPVGFVGSNTRNYTQDSGSALYRRSIYTFLKRTAPPPFMATFDAPNREQSCARRERSNTPLQALQLMNDVQHFEAARKLAERMMREAGTDENERLNWAYRLVLARNPHPQESDLLRRTLETHQTRYAADPEAAKAMMSYGESVPDPELSVPELAAWTLIANLLLNLDETLNRN